LRVPSLRDIVALEAGAVIGCCIWLAVGKRAILLCAEMLLGLSHRGRKRYVALKWPALFGFLLCELAAMNVLMGPADWFELYRRRSFMAYRPVVTARFISGPLLISIMAALGIWTICRLGEWAATLSITRSRRRNFRTQIECRADRHVMAADNVPSGRASALNHPAPPRRRAA
jgi:hypothetical protein